MKDKIIKYHKIALITIFIIAPILIYINGDFPRRSILKEVISIITIVSFFIMLLQFFLSRINRGMLEEHKMKKVINWHKVLGYIFVSVLFFHPFFIVLPRFFESGVDPQDAFIKLITSFEIKGFVLGVIAWVLMVLIGITSYFRDNLGMSYITWRLTHGYASVLFISIASLHVIDMGRHSNTAMIWTISILTIIAISLLLSNYIFSSESPKTNNNG